MEKDRLVLIFYGLILSSQEGMDYYAIDIALFVGES